MSDKAQQRREMHAEFIKTQAELQRFLNGEDAHTPDVWTDEYWAELGELRERFLAAVRAIDLINESTHN